MSMQGNLVGLLLLLALPMQSAEEIGIEAGLFTFDGKQLTLEQTVGITHPLGTVVATKAEVYPKPEGEKGGRFSQVELQEGLVVTFTEGGRLFAERGFFDFVQLQGHFFSSVSSPVTYKDEEWTMRGKEVALSLEKEEGHFLVDSLTLEEEVQIHYQKECFAQADYGTYQRGEGQQAKGTLSFRRSSPQGQCAVTRVGGDWVSADSMQVDEEKGEWAFVRPHGLLAFPSQKVIFSSGSLLWKEKEGHLELCDDVVITARGMGEMRAQEKLVFYKDPGGEKWQRIVASGPSHLSLEEGKYRVDSYGELSMDGNQICLTSPSKEEGALQVCLQSKEGRALADTVTLSLQDRWKLDGCVMEGQVRIWNHASFLFSGTEEQGEHYLAADRLEFFPKEQTMHFSGIGGRRVLLYEKEHNLQVSAPSLQIKKELDLKKESIKGLGDVRFCFVEAELARLQEEFSL